MAKRSVDIILNGKDKASKAFRSASKSANAFRKNLLGVAAALAGVSAVRAVGRGFSNAIKSVDGFNAKMLNSLAIMGDVSDVMKNEMRQAAIDVAKTTKFSASEAAEAFFFLASSGLNAEQSIAALPQVAQFAQAGMFDLARATELVTGSQNAMGLSSLDAEIHLENLTHVTDVLVKSNVLAQGSVQQFAEALTNKTAGAAVFANKSLEESIAVLAVFASKNLKGAEAGTAFNIVMRDMQTKSINNREEFERFGITVFDAAGEMRNMANIIGDMDRAFAGMAPEQKKAALMQLGFSNKSVVFTQTLLGTSKKIAEYEARLREAGGTTKEVADKQLTPMRKAMARFGGSFIEVTQKLQPAIDAIARVISALADQLMPIFQFISAGFASLRESISQPLQDIAQVLEVVFIGAFERAEVVLSAAFEGMVIGFNIVRDTVNEVFIGVGDTLTDFASVLNDFLMPVVEEVGAFMGQVFITAGEVITDAIEGVQIGFGLFKDFVNAVLKSVGLGTTKFSDVFKDMRDSLARGFQILRFLFANWRDFLVVTLLRVAAGLVAFKDRAVWILTKVIPAAGKFFRDNWFEIFTDIGNFTLTVFKNLASNIVTIIKNIPGLITGEVSFGDLWTPLTEGFKSALKEAIKIPGFKPSDLGKNLELTIKELETKLGKKFVEFIIKDKLPKAADVAPLVVTATTKVREDAKKKTTPEKLKRIIPRVLASLGKDKTAASTGVGEQSRFLTGVSQASKVRERRDLERNKLLRMIENNTKNPPGPAPIFAG